MVDGKIYITISDDRGNGNGGNTIINKTINNYNATNNTSVEGKDETMMGKFAQHQFFDFVKSQAKKIVNYSIGNIGNFTGDYRTQRYMQEVTQAVGTVMNLGMAFMAGGPVGLILAGAGMGISYALEEHANRIANKSQNYEISQLREISGLNTLTNGSR